MENNGVQLQSSLGEVAKTKTSADRTWNQGAIAVAKVTKVHPKRYTADVEIFGNNNAISSNNENEGKHACRIAVGSAGFDNTFMKPYGEICPIQAGDIVIVAFVQNDKEAPLIIGKLHDNSENDGDDNYRNILYASFNSDAQSNIDTYTKISPNQDFINVDYFGNFEIASNSKSFLVGKTQYIDDESFDWEQLSVKNLDGTTLSCKQQYFNPKRYLAVFRSDYNDVSTNYLKFFVDANKTNFRVSKIENHDNRVSYIELTTEGEIRAKRNLDTKSFEGSRNYSEYAITRTGDINIERHNLKYDNETKEPIEEVVSKINIDSEGVITAIAGNGKASFMMTPEGEIIATAGANTATVNISQEGEVTVNTTGKMEVSAQNGATVTSPSMDIKAGTMDVMARLDVVGISRLNGRKMIVQGDRDTRGYRSISTIGCATQAIAEAFAFKMLSKAMPLNAISNAVGIMGNLQSLNGFNFNVLNNIAQLTNIGNLGALGSIAGIARLGDLTKLTTIGDLAQLTNIGSLQKLANLGDLGKLSLSDLGNLGKLGTLGDLTNLGKALGVDISDIGRLGTLNGIDIGKINIGALGNIPLGELSNLKLKNILNDVVDLGVLNDLKNLPKQFENLTLKQISEIALQDVNKLGSLGNLAELGGIAGTLASGIGGITNITGIVADLPQDLQNKLEIYCNKNGQSINSITAQLEFIKEIVDFTSMKSSITSKQGAYESASIMYNQFTKLCGIDTMLEKAEKTYSLSVEHQSVPNIRNIIKECMKDVNLELDLSKGIPNKENLITVGTELDRINIDNNGNVITITVGSEDDTYGTLYRVADINDAFSSLYKCNFVEPMEVLVKFAQAISEKAGINIEVVEPTSHYVYVDDNGTYYVREIIRDLESGDTREVCKIVNYIDTVLNTDSLLKLIIFNMAEEILNNGDNAIEYYKQYAVEFYDEETNTNNASKE